MKLYEMKDFIGIEHCTMTFCLVLIDQDPLQRNETVSQLLKEQSVKQMHDHSIKILLEYKSIANIYWKLFMRIIIQNLCAQ